MDKCTILKEAKNIAVVGISRNELNISRIIAQYLVLNGYNVFGVNPNQSFNFADGIHVYNSLKEIPIQIDIVNVFRKSEAIPQIIDDVISIMPKVVWLQLGIRNDESVQKLNDLGITVVQDSCIKVEHSFCY
jgi:hypothetical protein